MVLSAALVVPIVLAVPGEARATPVPPETLRVEPAVTLDAPDSNLIWLDLADASGPRMQMPQIRAAVPEAGAPETCTQPPPRLPPARDAPERPRTAHTHLIPAAPRRSLPCREGGVP